MMNSSSNTNKNVSLVGAGMLLTVFFVSSNASWAWQVPATTSTHSFRILQLTVAQVRTTTTTRTAAPTTTTNSVSSYRPRIHHRFDSDATFLSSPSLSTRSKRVLLRVGPLAARKSGYNDDDNDKNDKEEEESNKLESFFVETQDRLSGLASQAQTWVAEQWKRWRLAIATFFLGIVLGVGAVVVPVIASAPLVQSLAKPVTLFEAILENLDVGYVEPVDTERLFETGITAMLGSLDPYTEYEGPEQAQELTESIGGKYGGIGLVISGSNSRALQKQQQDTEPLQQREDKDGVEEDLFQSIVMEEDDDEQNDRLEAREDELKERKRLERLQRRGIRVVSAFEGYAFDYGMRVGDKIVAVDDTPLTPTTSVEQVRNMLRGDPGTSVKIDFERVGLDKVQSVTIPRTIVQIRDVRLFTLLGDPADGMGYIQLSGFSPSAGREVRSAIRALSMAADQAVADKYGQDAVLTLDGKSNLKGLILDLRNNPGGLLTSAVDVSSLFVPQGSNIVSAKGRGFPGVIYRSRMEPVLDFNEQTKLAILVNGNTASAAEIVSGAVQDLDVGVIVGSGRTYGKGLVQNVQELPYNSALKFTIAKYYTPSGRCIQGVTYNQPTGKEVAENKVDENSLQDKEALPGVGNNKKKEGALVPAAPSFVTNKIEERDRSTFLTPAGRKVRDGGGIEADYKVPAQKMSILEFSLLRADVINDYAAEWSSKNQLTSLDDVITDETYEDFKRFVFAKQKEGDFQLEFLYDEPLTLLRRGLRRSGYKVSEKAVESLQSRIVQDMREDFTKYKTPIQRALAQSILSRYLPERMVLENMLQHDEQVQETIKLLRERGDQFDRLLARNTAKDDKKAAATSVSPSEALTIAASENKDESNTPLRVLPALRSN